MKYLIIIHLLFISTLAYMQNIKSKIDFDPDEILQRNYEPIPILLVGSFHFAYYGLDSHVTKEEDKVNVLSQKRQKEIEDLVNYIARFKPNKIVVEGGKNTGYLLRRFENYVEEPSTLRANEIDQIAFRLMKRFELDTLYGCDAGSLSRDLLMHKDSLVFLSFMDSIWRDEIYQDDEMDEKYFEYYDFDDKLALENTLLDFFLFMNSDKALNRGFGHYLVGGFKAGKYEGSDALILNWYSRNLRILRNIQDISKKGDRIMVLFGAGHMTILKNLFESTPEYDLIKFGDL